MTWRSHNQIGGAGRGGGVRTQTKASSSHGHIPPPPSKRAPRPPPPPLRCSAPPVAQVRRRLDRGSSVRALPPVSTIDATDFSILSEEHTPSVTSSFLEKKSKHETRNLNMSSTIGGSLSVEFGCLRKHEVRRLSTRQGSGRMLSIRASVVSSPDTLELSKANAKQAEKMVRVGVLGASGYTGAEIVRLLANHPHFGITLMTADRKAGQSIGSVFPHLITQDLPNMVAVKDADFSNVDAVFCCLPHGTTQEIIKGLPKGLKIVDLSADFRLRDINEYEEWYGLPHKAPELQKEAVYGLTEVLRGEIQNARLVANPGCYPTSIQLPLIPLIKAHLIELRNIIIDAKSGVSGAGRGAKEAHLYTEIAEGLHSYGITKHRHVPEIEQGLSDASNSKITVSFTPHLMPMSRGMQSTIYVEMAPGVNTDDLYEHLNNTYQAEEFVRLLEKGVVPHTRHVRGSNYCLMNVFQDRIPGRAIIISVIDNLVKGASGQALQNLNLMMGFPEDTGLQYQPLFP
ncbi:WD domain, G-beta repeat [Musa troglodytarum]|uniref:Probable N-acetyl-gamma-glutamyl-phosphate reductase, chloroplastic n=1 Tax=Musa troglodytarum TaxID=320322 RepID=A0A9E7I5I2_9LILI|nr:WD domain, G-beta repeat [Musa troglodytarum]URE45836.1 WD domain, G-beta repeat [Musa troglodytarum]URE45839.1 WD domain, G-beta repeat [Musa troglodytarum]